MMSPGSSTRPLPFTSRISCRSRSPDMILSLSIRCRVVVEVHFEFVIIDRVANANVIIELRPGERADIVRLRQRIAGVISAEELALLQRFHLKVWITHA